MVMIFSVANRESSGEGLLSMLGESRLTRFGGNLELGYETLENKDKSSDTKSKTELFTQEYRVDVGGYVWNPLFQTIDLSVYYTDDAERAFTIRQAESVKRTSSDINFSTTFLPKHRTSYTFYARKGVTEIDPDFANNYTLDNLGYGIRIGNRRYFPFTLNVSHFELNNDNEFAPIDEEINRAELYSSIGFSGRSQLDIEGRVEQRRDFVGVNTFDYYSLQFDHDYHITLGDYSFLRSNLWMERREQFLEFDKVRFMQDLRLEHTPRLNTNYGYSIHYRDDQGFGSTRYSARTGIRHRLYSSLFSSLTLRGERYVSDSTDALGYGYSFNEDYIKRIYFLNTNVGGGYNYFEKEQDLQATGGEVVDESHVLEDEIPVFLRFPKIDRSSLIVTDARGLVVYRENADYTVDASGDRLRITRVLDGRIPDGGVVRTQYSYSQEGTQSVVSEGYFWNVGARTNFSRRFYIFGQHHESTTSDNLGFDDTTVTDEVGYEWDWRWFTFSSKYKRHEATEFMSTSWLHRATFRINPTYNSYLHAAASYQTEEFGVDKFDRELYWIDSVLRYRPFRRMLVSARAYYEIENQDDREEITSELEGEIEYFIAQVWIGFSWEYEENPDFYETKTSINIRRNF